MAATLHGSTLVTLNEFEVYVESELNVTLNGAGADAESLIEALNLGLSFILSAFLERGYTVAQVATITGARGMQRNAAYHFYLLDALGPDYDKNKAWVDDIIKKVADWIANTKAFFDSTGAYVVPDPTTAAASVGQPRFTNRNGTADSSHDRLWDADSRQTAGDPWAYGRGRRYSNQKWS